MSSSYSMASHFATSWTVRAAASSSAILASRNVARSIEPRLIDEFRRRVHHHVHERRAGGVDDVPVQAGEGRRAGTFLRGQLELRHTRHDRRGYQFQRLYLVAVKARAPAAAVSPVRPGPREGGGDTHRAQIIRGPLAHQLGAPPRPPPRPRHNTLSTIRRLPPGPRMRAIERATPHKPGRSVNPGETVSAVRQASR